MPILSIPPNSPDTPQNGLQSEPRSQSPKAPPYSPITPTMSYSLPATSTEAAAAANNNNNSYNKNGNQYPYAPPPAHRPSDPPRSQPSNPYAPIPSARPPPTVQMSEPPQPVPISESTNPDAIALRAAMSILQLQRQQALRDMQTLERQKEAAVADPEAFARDVASGKIKARKMRGVLGPVGEVGEVQDSSNGVGHGRDEGLQGGVVEHVEDGEAMDEDSENGGDNSTAEVVGAFGEIPSEQNVVRMPPINWAKYHIVGESLDKLHEEQRSRPVPGQPLRDEDLKPRPRAPEHVIASPYDPWRDKLEGKEKGRTRSGRGKG